MKVLALCIAATTAIGAINMVEDELEWSIGDQDSLDFLDYEAEYEGIDPSFFGGDIGILKSADSKKTFTSGGIRVRNMGRIMKMAMFIQKKPAKNFIREFKRYGCHCWPKGRTILGGQGRPQDDVDRTCKKLFNCHKCLVINSAGKCSPDQFQYKVRGKDEDGDRNIHCDGNPIGSCQRSLCECDLSFALELEENRKYYQESNSKWKGFQSNQECTASGQNLGARSNLINQTPVPVPEELLVHNGFACCGTNYDNYTPYRPEKGQRCCARKNQFSIYGVDKGQKCCADGTIGETNGDCPADF